MAARKMPAKKAERIERYAADNRECAAVILANPAKYGGADALPVIWARMILAGDKREKTPAAWRLVA